jgi:hypothetical protein
LHFYSTKKTLKGLFDLTDHSLDQMNWPDAFARLTKKPIQCISVL